MDKIITMGDIKEKKRKETLAKDIHEFAKTHSVKGACLQVLDDYKTLVDDIANTNYLLNLIISKHGDIKLEDVDNTIIDDSIETISSTIPTVMSKLREMVEQIDELDSKK
jgi:hypothetical protein